MSIAELVTAYVTFRRALGERLRDDEYILRAFGRRVGPEASPAAIAAEAVVAFLAGNGPVTRTWHRKYDVLKGFFRFAVSRGHMDKAPLPTVLPKQPPRFIPYIYSRDDLLRLLEGIATYRRYHIRIEPETRRAILLVLYGAGLRAGEALRLTVADVDLPNAILTVRETKFFKTRLVPIGRQLAEELNQYARWQATTRPTTDLESRFFLGRGGARITLGTLQYAFRRLREYADVRRSDGARYQPRLHDLRHTFAVHRLTEWYRQGADVPRLLHHLSVYLGHAYLAGTQVYLTMIPELLNEAGNRFERYALGEESHA